MKKNLAYNPVVAESGAETENPSSVLRAFVTSGLLEDFKQKLIADGTSAPTFVYLPGDGSESGQEISHKLNRIIGELKYIEQHYPKFSSLTCREKEIIGLIVTSHNNQQISEKLFISIRTVEQHRKNINRKLETTSIPEICAFAYAFNLV